MARPVRLGVATLLGVLLVCSATKVAAAPPPEWTDASRGEAAQLEARLAALPPAPPGQVRVHLAFGQEVDLDLYVTGPLEETVYYANTPSAIGGELLADRHCEEADADAAADDAPRIETVRFAPATAGHYRVGIDFPHVCQGDRQPVAFVVMVETPEGRRTERGLAAFEYFQSIVLEFDFHPQETSHAP